MLNVLGCKYVDIGFNKCVDDPRRSFERILVVGSRELEGSSKKHKMYTSTNWTTTI